MTTTMTLEQHAEAILLALDISPDSHTNVEAILTACAALLNSEANPWRTAIIDELCTWHVLPDEALNDPRAAFALLLKLDRKANLDPDVSEGAAALFDAGAAAMRQRASRIPELDLAGNGAAIEISDAIRAIAPASMRQNSKKEM